MASNFIPIENLLNDMNHLEQYANSVVDYTSRYSDSNSISYSPDNIIGKYTRYPAYGDFPETYILRSYGRWWKESEAFQQSYRPQDDDHFGAEDYITLRYNNSVVPRDIYIYETYNPGAVVRIWGRYIGKKWKLLWQGLPQSCSQEPRLFHPQLNRVNCLVKDIRIEFNQSHLKYFTAIDAVLLAGYQIKPGLKHSILQEDLFNWRQEFKSESSDKLSNKSELDVFGKLPYEIIVHIFMYLDLKSLKRCAQVNRIWKQVASDPILYQNLNLKVCLNYSETSLIWATYWNRVTASTLDYFRNHCTNLKKLDLSWCGDDLDDHDFRQSFHDLLDEVGDNLTHLSLCQCNFIDDQSLTFIAKCTNLIELRLKSCLPISYGCLSRLTKLITLDLSNTAILTDDLKEILLSNSNLKHLIMDFCRNLNLNEILHTINLINLKLTVWSSWKTKTLTPNQVALLANCHNLTELDLGWCLFNLTPDDCLERIANNCPKLKRLILSAWRALGDRQLQPIITYCTELIQLDLLGIRGITNDFCERALNELKKLRLLDLSFCESVSHSYVKLWRRTYPDVMIQRSCLDSITDHYN